VGVQSLFGKIQSTVLNSGLNIINPLVDVKDVDVRTQNYTMSGVHDEGERSGDDAIRVLTRDGLEVTIDLSVLYRVNAGNAPKLIQMVGVEFKDKIIRPVTRTKIRDNAVYYDAVELYSTKRDEFQTRIFKGIDDEFNKRGLILENLLVRNISLPQTVKLTIESKINAEQDAQKMQFVLQKEKQEAERKRVEAQGIADYQRIISEGLTEKQLRYEQIKAYKEIASSTNTKVIIMPDKGSNVILDTK
jgi:regulator of protease activity HflC (stomatin/prohibitin superfamily)